MVAAKEKTDDSGRLNFVANNDFRVGRDHQNENKWAIINPRTGAIYLGETLHAAIDAAMGWAAGIKAAEIKKRDNIILSN